MPSLTLTKASIAALVAPDPSGRQQLYWDAEIKGFAVLVSGVSDAKTFEAQGLLDGRTCRCTIGKVAVWMAAGKTVKDARVAAATILLDLQRGVSPKDKGAAPATLQEALDRYLLARPNLAANSRANYRTHVERHFRRWLKRPLRKITADMIEARYRAIKDEVAARQRGGGEDAPFAGEPGAGTANASMRALRLIWNFSVARDAKLAPWPTQRLRGQWYRLPSRERHVAASDLRRFYETAGALDERGDYLLGRTRRDFILTLLFSGLRRREASGLKWGDLDLGAAIIHISAKRAKAKRQLDLPMSDFVYDLLVARRALGTEGAYVFPGDGRSGHLENPTPAFAAIARRCGIHLSPHDLRRTYATIAASCPEVSHFQLQGLLNHSVGGGVTAGYVRLTAESLRPAAQAVADRIKEHCGIAPEEAENVRPLRPGG